MSEVKVNKISPRSGTDVQLGDSGDTITVPSGATFDASNATTTLPANIVTTDGSQTLTNKTIDASQLSGTITPSDNTVTLAKLTATGTKDATTFLRGDNTFATPTAGFTLGTQVSASGTSIEFTSIPSTARMIVINTDGLSFTGAGNTNLTMLLGDSGGYESSGYKSTIVYLSTNSGEASPGGAGAAGDIILNYQPDQSNTYHGQIILTCQDTTNNTWNYTGLASSYSAGYIQCAAGVKSLSGTLDRIKIAWAGGQSFDAGTANIMYI